MKSGHCVEEVTWGAGADRCRAATRRAGTSQVSGPHTRPEITLPRVAKPLLVGRRLEFTEEQRGSFPLGRGPKDGGGQRALNLRAEAALAKPFVPLVPESGRLVRVDAPPTGEFAAGPVVLSLILLAVLGA